ncbi:unnamed protein product [Phytophthora lilii]|uniref:Unnamed protein product n=1 Tax=Phytophthora lilii TaxID=2077276 RepID=A0A9W6TD04_9STRA|nr:unnamed protein product [Phytophthora lilii]
MLSLRNEKQDLEGSKTSSLFHDYPAWVQGCVVLLSICHGPGIEQVLFSRGAGRCACAASTNASGNPDIVVGSNNARATSIDYYPIWPVFDSQNQRISACDDNPGSGMNPNQGRGAPEINILEGGGTEISSSMQLGPGMPEEFRLIADNETAYWFYSYDCSTTGANNIDVPTSYYADLRGQKSWY